MLPMLFILSIPRNIDKHLAAGQWPGLRRDLPIGHAAYLSPETYWVPRINLGKPGALPLDKRAYDSIRPTSQENSSA